ncbi:MAG: hypothetical protein LLG00_12635 [Planctomycetaceae bacterium]|nr:hypothetical protein [Planctomycetaceae bacterium]
MPLRRRKSPAPFFKQLPAFNPVTGQFAPIGNAKGPQTRLALFQVVEDDTYDNYVLCRGQDVEAGVFFDAAHPIAVAKAYSRRGLYPYNVGDILVACIVRTALGDNPGVASESTGQPADLEEEIELLYADDGTAIRWMELAVSPSPPPIQYYMSFVQEGTNTWNVTRVSPDAGLRASCMYVAAGDADASKVETVSEGVYNDPTLSVKAPGLWRFDVGLLSSYPSITQTAITGVVTGNQCSISSIVFGGLNIIVQFETRPRGGEWGLHDYWHGHVRSFNNGYPSASPHIYGATLVDLASDDEVRVTVWASAVGGAKNTDYVNVAGRLLIQRLG